MTVKSHENEIDIKVIAAQLGVLRFLFTVLVPLLCGALLMIGGWAYGQGAELTDLKGTVRFQEKEISRHEAKIDNTAASVGKMGSDIQANRIHLVNIKEMVKEIAGILREKINDNTP